MVEKTSTTILRKKEYYVFTDSRCPSHFIENFGDRAFYLRKSRHGGYTMNDSWLIGGDPLWEINEKNLTDIANATFDSLLKQIKEDEKEEAISKHSMGACPDCGAPIGLLGRGFEKIFGKNHDCKGFSA